MNLYSFRIKFVPICFEQTRDIVGVSTPGVDGFCFVLLNRFGPISVSGRNDLILPSLLEPEMGTSSRPILPYRALHNFQVSED